MTFLTRATDVAAAASLLLFLGVAKVAHGFPSNIPPRTFRDRRADAKNVLALGAVDVPPESLLPSDEDIHPSTTRRGALVKAAAAALSLTGIGTSPAVAAAASSSAPTRIELTVETDDLVRVLNYFDGDMRRVLGAIVRSPFTNVRIDPPSSKEDRQARDAILRALYSYESPEDYALQAKWVTVEEPDTSLVGTLTKKRFQVTLPSGTPSSGDDSVQTTVSLSLLEAGLGLGVLSYPLGYAFYRYENYQEEQQAKERKAKMAAKKKAAAEAAKKKKEGDGAKAPKSKGKTTAAAAATKKEEKKPKAKETKAVPKAEPPTEATVVADARQSKKIDSENSDGADPVELANKWKQIVEAKKEVEQQSAPVPPPPPAPPAPGNEEDRARMKSKDAMDEYARQYAAMAAAAARKKNPPNE